jgi:hypothetical protein
MFVFIIIGIVLLLLGIFLFTGGCGKDSFSRSAIVEEFIKVGYTSEASNELGDLLDKTGDGCINKADLGAIVASGDNTGDISDAWIGKYGFKPGLENIFASLYSQSVN